MKITLDLPVDLVNEIKLRAAQEGKTLNDTIAELLRKGLGSRKPGLATFVKVDKAMLKRCSELTRKFITGV